MKADEKKNIIEKIENEKELVKTICIGLVHPDQANQKEFTKWLQNTVIFHLENLKKNLLKNETIFIIEKIQEADKN